MVISKANEGKREGNYFKRRGEDMKKFRIIGALFIALILAGCIHIETSVNTAPGGAAGGPGRGGACNLNSNGKCICIGGCTCAAPLQCA